MLKWLRKIFGSPSDKQMYNDAIEFNKVLSFVKRHKYENGNSCMDTVSKTAKKDYCLNPSTGGNMIIGYIEQLQKKIPNNKPANG